MSDQQQHLEGIPPTLPSADELSVVSRDGPPTVPANCKVLADEITSTPATTNDTVPANEDAEVTTISSTFQDLGAMALNLLGYAEPRAIRDQVLQTPELCAAVLDHLWDYDLCNAAVAGGPFLDTIRAFPHLRKEMLLDYDPDVSLISSTHFTFNPFFFWHSVFCGHKRRSGCGCDMWESMPRFADDKGGEPLPKMEIDLTHHTATEGAEPIELRFLEAESLTTTLNSGSLLLAMRLGSPAKHVKIVIQNPETMTWVKEWQAPPSPIEWHMAEITIDITNLRMYSLIRIAKNLLECANTIDAKTFTGEATIIDEETGTVEDAGWKTFFNASHLKAVVGDDGPKYCWFWKGDAADRWVGATYAEAREFMASTFPAIIMP